MNEIISLKYLEKDNINKYPKILKRIADNEKNINL